MDHYRVLELDQTASQDDIKRAYRKLAMKHHPDRGGSQEKFQQINHAYHALTNPNTQPNTHSPFESFNDHLFRNFGWTHAVRKQVLTISLEECWCGTKKQISGRVIEIPPGVRHNTVVNLSNLEQLIIQIQPHAQYQRNQDDLLTTVTIGISQAVLGTTVRFRHLSGNQLEVKIPSGIQPGQVIRLQNQGLPNPQWPGRRGSLFCEVAVRVPKLENLTAEQKSAILNFGH